MSRKKLTLGTVGRPRRGRHRVGARASRRAPARRGRTDDNVVGAGSSFVAPLMTAWYQFYNPKAGTNVSYNSVGSGAGIASITARTVDFGASDAPLTPDQFSNCKDCVQIPVALGTTSVLYNLPGVAQQIKLTGAIIADIYLGKITQWDASQIKAINPGVDLPSMKITPAYRSDGSGTSYNFTDYLSKVSPDSRQGRQVDAAAVPARRRARGSSGVAESSRRHPARSGMQMSRSTDEQAPLRQGQEQGRRLRNAWHPGAVAAAGSIKTHPVRQRDHDRRPSGDRRQARLPDQHVRVGDRSGPVEAGGAGQAVPSLRDQQARAAAGPEAACTRRSRTVSGSRPPRRSQRLSRRPDQGL